MCHRLAPVASHGASTLEKGLPVFRFGKAAGSGNAAYRTRNSAVARTMYLSSGCDATEGRNEANLRAQP